LNFFRITAVCCVCLGWSAGCYADSLLITYRDGSTQKVPLDKSISAISTLQYLNLETAPADAVKFPQQDTGLRPVESKPDSPPEPDIKNNFKFKWAEPVIGQ